MKLPEDRSNWTQVHAERAVKACQAAFDRYEAKYDADKEAETNALYGEYLTAETVAKDVIIATNTPWLLKELP